MIFDQQALCSCCYSDLFACGFGQIIALLAKYHRKKVPSSKDGDFAMLPEEVQKKVQAMCAVMRIAVALDRCDTSAIEHVHVYQRPGSVMLVRVSFLARLF
jgi:exopolyphosphatase/pppGpp-phosphohydrolase